MDLLNLDLEQYKTYVAHAFTHVYGEKYRDIIQDRIERTLILNYNDIEGLKHYINRLLIIKSYQLGISFLKQIGYDVTKYEEKRPIELIDDKELFVLLRPYLGNIYDCFDDPEYVRIKALNSNEYGFVELLNEMYKEKEITKENLHEFMRSDDYIKILEKIKEYNKIYDELQKEYKRYEETLKDYKKYIDLERKRKSEIYEDGIKRIIIKIYPYLPSALKEKINNSTQEEIKVILFGVIDDNDFTDGLLLDFFDKKNISELNSKDIKIYKKNFIKEWQISYLKNFDIGLPNREIIHSTKEEDLDTYLKFLEREDVKELIPSSDVIDIIHEICEEEANNCLKEYYTERDDFKKIMKLCNLDSSYEDWLLDFVKNKRICITGEGATINGRYASVMFYTARNLSFGNMAINYIHEMGHICDDMANTMSGIEINDCNIKNPYNSSKRKYEVMNEALNDIFTMEAANFLNSNNIYLFEGKENTNLDYYSDNMGTLTKDILRPLVRLYRDYVIEAKINADKSILTNYIGEENFEELNDIVNKVEYLCSKGVKYKLEKNEECEEVIEYNKQLDRAQQVYKNIEEYILNNLNENKSKSMFN